MNDFAGLPKGNINWENGNRDYGSVNYGQEQVVIFYTRSVQNMAKTASEGRKIFEDTPYIRMHPPGERLNVVDRPVNGQDRERFAKQWNNYIHSKTQVPEGVPIDLLFPNHPSVAEALRANFIFTVEQCAELSATAIDNIGMGGQEYVNKAKKYLANASSGANFHIIQKELENSRNEVATLKSQLELAINQIKALDQRLTNPLQFSTSPPYIPGYDVQAERINSNHVTSDPVIRTKTPITANKPEEF